MNTMLIVLLGDESNSLLFLFSVSFESANERLKSEQASGVTIIEQIHYAEGPITHPTQIYIY